MKNPKTLLAALLAALLLCGCGAPQTAQTQPEAAPSPAAEEKAVVVTDADGLLAALAPHTVIEIDAEHLALDRAADYGFSYSDGAYTWQKTDTREFMLVIRGLEGLTIRGRGGSGTVLSTGSTYSDVLRFEDCGALTLEGLTLGHRGEPGSCAGDVLSLKGCADVKLRGCDLFGCGVIAVNAYLCERVYLDGCTLRDCTLCALNATCCTDIQLRDCEIARCGGGSYLGALCAASCNGLAVINSRFEGCETTVLLDAMNSPSVCLLGCEAKGNRFSEALFRLSDYKITVSGSALSDNEFGSCYVPGGLAAVNGAGQELLSFADFARMERKAFTGEYIGPATYVTPSDIAAPEPEEEWDGVLTEVHAQTVDELIAAIAPHTVVYLEGTDFDLSTASDYSAGEGRYYTWVQTYDGPELALHDLTDFTLVGGGAAITLLSAVPRYANVLSFENCRGVRLQEMTLGHKVEPGFCMGDVLELNFCEDVSVDHCGLFGCGEIGIRASQCSDLFVSDTSIYQCSYLGAHLTNVQNALFTGCTVTDCGGEYGFNGIFLDGCSSVFYDKDSLTDGNYYIGAAG